MRELVEKIETFLNDKSIIEFCYSGRDIPKPTYGNPHGFTKDELEEYLWRMNQPALRNRLEHLPLFRPRKDTIPNFYNKHLPNGGVFVINRFLKTFSPFPPLLNEFPETSGAGYALPIKVKELFSLVNPFTTQQLCRMDDEVKGICIRQMVDCLMVDIKKQKQVLLGPNLAFEDEYMMNRFVYLVRDGKVPTIVSNEKTESLLSMIREFLIEEFDYLFVQAYRKQSRIISYLRGEDNSPYVRFLIKFHKCFIDIHPKAVSRLSNYYMGKALYETDISEALVREYHSLVSNVIEISLQQSVKMSSPDRWLSYVHEVISISPERLFLFISKEQALLLLGKLVDYFNLVLGKNEGSKGTFNKEFMEKCFIKRKYIENDDISEWYPYIHRMHQVILTK